MTSHESPTTNRLVTGHDRASSILLGGQNKNQLIHGLGPMDYGSQLMAQRESFSYAEDCEANRDSN